MKIGFYIFDISIILDAIRAGSWSPSPFINIAGVKL